MNTRFVMPLVLVAGFAAGAGHALADPAARPDRNCYEDIGCPWKVVAPLATLRKLSCQALAHVRNHTYYENFYCFHSAAAVSAYGNTDCKYHETGRVPLNTSERQTLAHIRQVEDEKGCH